MRDPMNEQEPPHVDDAVIAVYVHAVRNGRFHRQDTLGGRLTDVEVERAIKNLVRLQALRPLDTDEDTYTAVDPETAFRQSSAPLARRIEALSDARERLQQDLALLQPAFESARTEPDRSDITVVMDPVEVMERLRQEAANCVTDVLTVQPGGGRSAATLDAAKERDLSMLERGVDFRILYQHTARGSIPTGSYVRALTQAGAEVRTIEELPERLFIFDRRLAVIPDRRAISKVPGAVFITNPPVVAFLYSVFESNWSKAVRWWPTAVGYQEAIDDVKLSVLRLMAMGYTDDVVARRLGVSVRTCRRHIADLMEEMGANSRFEAGVAAAETFGIKRSPDIERIDDE
ncbi:LuxR C-terminal-related transcriptional regulator [Streptomyces sp. NPDC048623]|uniref:LuxR C-terminal-related transcriptional regulator n=1 Tax=Streptomyces sp. NPDC048623 TaxID=3155761 RepID=UPI0034173CD6